MTLVVFFNPSKLAQGFFATPSLLVKAKSSKCFINFPSTATKV